MARRDLAGELSRKPLGVKLGILGGVLAVLGFFYWQFFYSSLSDETKALEGERKKLTKQETTLKDRKKEYENLLREKQLLDEELKNNQITLPATSELPAFFMHLQKQAAAAGVTISKSTRRNEGAVESYVRVPVSMEVTGTWYQLTNYFRLLGQTDRIISVSSLVLRPKTIKNDEIVLAASFVATTFRKKDAPPDTTLGEGEGEAAEGEGGGDTGPRRGSRQGAGRFAQDALDQQSAVEQETGDQAARESGNAQRGVDRLTNPGGGAPTP